MFGHNLPQWLKNLIYDGRYQNSLAIFDHRNNIPGIQFKYDLMINIPFR